MLRWSKTPALDKLRLPRPSARSLLQSRARSRTRDCPVALVSSGGSSSADCPRSRFARPTSISLMPAIAPLLRGQQAPAIARLAKSRRP